MPRFLKGDPIILTEGDGLFATETKGNFLRYVTPDSAKIYAFNRGHIFVKRAQIRHRKAVTA